MRLPSVGVLSRSVEWPGSDPVTSPEDSALTTDERVARIERPAPEIVKAHLGALWVETRVAAVRDSELGPAIDGLMDCHEGSGYFEARLDGMRRVSGFGPDGDFEVALAPNRTKAPILREDGQGPCGLCEPTMPRQRGLSWRDYRIWPNAFPYVPAQDQHILITSSHHQAQTFSPAMLADLLDFQALAAQGRPLSLFYNGIAGNSQFHLHWQAPRVSLPLGRALDDGRLVPQTVRRDGEGRVQIYDHGVFAGFLLSGTKPYLIRWASEIVSRLDRDPLTRGAYNLVLLEPRNGEARLAIIPRRADCLKPTLGSLGPRGIGAFNMAGILVLPQGTIPDDFNATVTAALRTTIVPPSELGFLDALRQLPGKTLAQRPRS